MGQDYAVERHRTVPEQNRTVLWLGFRKSPRAAEGRQQEGGIEGRGDGEDPPTHMTVKF